MSYRAECQPTKVKNIRRMEFTQIRMLQIISGMTLKDKAKSELILKMICVEPLKGIFEKANSEVVLGTYREQKKAPVMAIKIIRKGKKKRKTSGTMDGDTVLRKT